MMTPSGFEALVKLLRMTGPQSIEAARLVLVDGMRQVDAAKATGLTAQGVSQVVKACKAGLALAKIASGVEF